MPQILNKGYSFGATEQVTSTKLGQLVDNATFASTAVVGGGGLELSGGALQIANSSITPTKLSSGAPTWDGSNNLTVNGTLTTGGTISTSGNLAVNGAAAITGDSTLSGKIIRAGSSPNRTVELQTAATSGNANRISFGWDNPDLLVQIDDTTFRVTLTPV